MERNYMVCKRCVMDTTDSQIGFDSHGVCNHCREYDFLVTNTKLSEANTKKILDATIRDAKKKGRSNAYDCVVGISGGVDSTYLVYLIKRVFGLSPLVVHLDNGWNSKLAVRNIHQIVKKLDVPLYTHVIDWEEFKSLQLAYLKASVIDIEMLTDHAILAILYRMADEFGVKYIFSGSNFTTEKIMPKSWTFNKNDLQNILSIGNLGTQPIKTFPTLGFRKLLYYKTFKKIRHFKLLNFINYNREEAKNIIIKELGWENYGEKHFESVFTRFYIACILPEKFKVDFRRSHFSTLICSGQMTREEAIEELRKPAYDENQMRQDYEFVLKKFELTEDEFEKYMSLPEHSHFNYKTDLYSKLNKKYFSPNNPIIWYFKRLFYFYKTLFPKSSI